MRWLPRAAFVLLLLPAAAYAFDEAELAKANELYEVHGLGARDDALAMQYLIPGWKYDNKRPCMVR